MVTVTSQSKLRKNKCKKKYYYKIDEFLGALRIPLTELKPHAMTVLL